LVTSSPRKSLSKKTRFEVFKRDGFVCQYCGSKPPSVVLHVDHIVAVAAGGGNEMDNLVTSCSSCNQGKSDRDLRVAPQSLSDKAADIAEREQQLLGYQSVMQEKSDRLDAETWEVVGALKPGADHFPRRDFLSVRMFVERLGLFEVLEAADIATLARMYGSRKFRYFCGVCWKKIKGSEADA